MLLFANFVAFLCMLRCASAFFHEYAGIKRDLAEQDQSTAISDACEAELKARACA